MRGCKTGKRVSIIVRDKSIMLSACNAPAKYNIATAGINRPCSKLTIILLFSRN
jgi:hypothetical protein